MARRAFDIFATVFPEASGWTLDRAGPLHRAGQAVRGHPRRHRPGSRGRRGARRRPAGRGGQRGVGRLAAAAAARRPAHLARPGRADRGRAGRGAGPALGSGAVAAAHPGAAGHGPPHRRRWPRATGRRSSAREEESRARYENVVEHSSDGIYEVDLDGRIQYANPSLAVILGLRARRARGRAARRRARAPSTGAASLERPHAGRRRRLAARRADRRRAPTACAACSTSRTMARVPGRRARRLRRAWSATSPPRDDLEAEKNEFLALVTHDLRNPLTTILGLGATLETHADELPADRIQRMGGSIRRQAERIARLADDLYDVSRLEAAGRWCSARGRSTCARRSTTRSASVDDPSGVERAASRAALERAGRSPPARAGRRQPGRERPRATAPRPSSSTSSGTDATASCELAVTDHGPGVGPTLVARRCSRRCARSAAPRPRPLAGHRPRAVARAGPGRGHGRPGLVRAGRPTAAPRSVSRCRPRSAALTATPPPRHSRPRLEALVAHNATELQRIDGTAQRRHR